MLRWLRRRKSSTPEAALKIAIFIEAMFKFPDDDSVKQLLLDLRRYLADEVENPDDAFAAVGAQLFEYRAPPPSDAPDAPLGPAQRVYLNLYHVMRNQGVLNRPLPTADNAW